MTANNDPVATAPGSEFVLECVSISASTLPFRRHEKMDGTAGVENSGFPQSSGIN